MTYEELIVEETSIDIQKLFLLLESEIELDRMDEYFYEEKKKPKKNAKERIKATIDRLLEKIKELIDRVQELIASKFGMEDKVIYISKKENTLRQKMNHILSALKTNIKKPSFWIKLGSVASAIFALYKKSVTGHRIAVARKEIDKTNQAIKDIREKIIDIGVANGASISEMESYMAKCLQYLYSAAAANKDIIMHAKTHSQLKKVSIGKTVSMYYQAGINPKYKDATIADGGYSDGDSRKIRNYWNF